MRLTETVFNSILLFALSNHLTQSDELKLSKFSVFFILFHLLDIEYNGYCYQMQPIDLRFKCELKVNFLVLDWIGIFYIRIFEMVLIVIDWIYWASGLLRVTTTVTQKKNPLLLPVHSKLDIRCWINSEWVNGSIVEWWMMKQTNPIYYFSIILKCSNKYWNRRIENDGNNGTIESRHNAFSISISISI